MDFEVNNQFLLIIKMYNVFQYMKMGFFRKRGLEFQGSACSSISLHDVSKEVNFMYLEKSSVI